ncbi:hypothetical protein BKA70DRAFT_1452212 [Coprinopsis sp. MPI-PUGE-AT-0042]|nr:hypothetical protein BKA70DRAFT_1452212 [Coprinopsis sp. MPI-PUGE-AT-0042]
MQPPLQSIDTPASESPQPLTPYGPAQDPDAPLAHRRLFRACRLQSAPNATHDDTDSGSASEDDSLPEPLQALDQSTSGAPKTGVNSPPGIASSKSAEIHHSIAGAGRKQWWQSRPNKFLLWRQCYGSHPPTSDPEKSIGAEDLDDSLGSTALPGSNQHPCDPISIDQQALGPFPNSSSFLFANWWWNGQNDKSSKELEKFLALGRNHDFSFNDVLSTNWSATLKALDSDDGDCDGDPWYDDANWISAPITIPVPFHRLMKNSGIETQEVGIFQHRRIISVVEEKIQNMPPGTTFHYQPSEGELYNSPAFVMAHKALQDSPPIPGCNLEQVIIALMFWSDETHLSAFGSAKVWPCYMFFGNESKYRRSKTSLKLCEHVAYFDSLSDDFKDYL